MEGVEEKLLFTVFDDNDQLSDKEQTPLFSPGENSRVVKENQSPNFPLTRKEDKQCVLFSQKYTEQEDVIIKKIVESMGKISWKKVSEELADHRIYRTPGSISQHYRRFICKENRPFTAEEDQLILELHNAGFKWSAIAAKIGNFTDGQVRYRFMQLDSQKKHKNE